MLQKVYDTVSLDVALPVNSEVRMCIGPGYAFSEIPACFLVRFSSKAKKTCGLENTHTRPQRGHAFNQ